MGVGPIRRMTPADLGLDPRAAGLQDGRSPLGGMNVALSQIARSFRPPGNTTTGNTETSIWYAEGTIGSASSTAGDFEPIPLTTVAFLGGDDEATVEASSTGLTMSDGLWHYDISVGVWASDSGTDVGLYASGYLGPAIVGTFNSETVIHAGGTYDAQVHEHGSGIAIGGSSSEYGGISVLYRLFAAGGGTLSIDSAQARITLHRLTSDVFVPPGGG